MTISHVLACTVKDNLGSDAVEGFDIIWSDTGYWDTYVLGTLRRRCPFKFPNQEET